MNTQTRLRSTLFVLLVMVLFTRVGVAGTTVKVMTYNVDEGTDFRAIVGVLANGGDLGAAIQQTIAEVQNSHPEVRAQLIANEIATAQPDLVGLQEAAVWTFPTGQLDILQLILQNLPNYQPVVIQPEFQIDLTQQFGVAFADRDVILVRSNVFDSITSNQGHYSNLVPISSAYLPGTTAIIRGWAAVDGTKNGTTFRFITTHLEDGTNTLSPIFLWVQALQEIELIYSPQTAATTLPVIIGGDFNTVANDPMSPTYPSYRFMLLNGFTDAWTAAGHGRGATCCQEDLTLRRSELTQRIDQVFTRHHITVMNTQLDGDAIVREAGYWPSDHAAVESELNVGP